MRPIALFLVLLLGACAGQPPACGLTAHASLPVEPAGPFAAVPSTVNNVPARFVVDTGASNSVLSQTAATRSGVATDLKRVARSAGIGGSATYPTGRVDHLVLGGLPVDPAIMTVMPAVPLLDGNIGMDILGDVDLDVDLPGHRITLYRGQLCPGAMPPWEAPPTELATHVSMPRLLPRDARPRMMLVEMELDGTTALAMLDTGSARSLVSKGFAARLGVNDAALARAPTVRLTGLSRQTAQGWLWQFGDARIGRDHFSGPRLIVADLPDAPFDVLLGMDYLSHHRVWISFRSHRVFVLRA
jgi:predicted aspartyl protease